MLGIKFFRDKGKLGNWCILTNPIQMSSTVLRPYPNKTKKKSINKSIQSTLILKSILA
jgi:hypothetical protein